MQCRNCGFMLPAGAEFCTNCGAKLNNQGNPWNQPEGPSQVEPTIAASSTYETPPMAPSSNQQAVPPTVYGAPYSTPQQYSYEAPPPPPPANMYGAPPTSNPYGAPYAPTPGSYLPPGQPPTPPTRRRGPGVGLIIGLVVLLLLVVGGGFLAIHAATSGSTTNTVTPTATTAQPTATTPITPTPLITPTTGGPTPSGVQIDPTAAAIITKAQTSSAIDSNDFPTQVSSNFKTGQNVYVTFNLTTNNQSGYTEAKLYSNTTYVGNKILTIQSSFDHGYFTVTLNQASTGAVELYWCTQSNCSDAKLATFVTFTAA
jgi:zinc-ribbon domain